MIIGTDSAGKVCLVGSGEDAATMPADFNGMAITSYVLTAEQKEAFLALNPTRGGTTFDGTVFASVPAVIVPPIDLSDVDNIEKGLKALALCIAQVGGLTVPQMKVMFKQKWDSLP